MEEEPVAQTVADQLTGVSDPCPPSFPPPLVADGVFRVVGFGAPFQDSLLQENTLVGEMGSSYPTTEDPRGSKLDLPVTQQI